MDLVNDGLTDIKPGAGKDGILKQLRQQASICKGSTARKQRRRKYSQSMQYKSSLTIVLPSSSQLHSSSTTREPLMQAQTFDFGK